MQGGGKARCFKASRRTLAVFAALAASSATLLLPTGKTGRAQTAGDQYTDFDRHSAFSELSLGVESGVAVGRSASGGEVRLSGGRTRGTLTSKGYPVGLGFDTLVPSWNARTPGGTWLTVEVRVRDRGTGWSRWFSLGNWASDDEAIKRGSVNGQSTDRWAVSTDTLKSRGRVFADAYQYRITLNSKKAGRSPVVRAVSFVVSDSYRHGESVAPASDRGAWGENLTVPERSQMIYPGGGEVWCSPTSLSMVMAYWSGRRDVASWNKPVPTVASATYDNTYRGNGNWPFNVAYASSLGLDGDVSRFGSLAQAEKWIEAEVPVVASIAWGRGQLDGAAIPSSAGHLLVIRGFTETGDVVVNDPAASSDAGVRRTYDREQFRAAWMRGSGGIVYLVRPAGWKRPATGYSAGSW
ncbi:peptidase C39 family protein [Rubrobacter indicoceani]|uniref:peptidase C39 family protein n=1 Tax=Rubrobacter indicoceani TaxID=2051957 RepID=UPI0013C48B86|nr:peptidase C39 family protein [Rubrobacter indicoceani]